MCSNIKKYINYTVSDRKPFWWFGDSWSEYSWSEYSQSEYLFLVLIGVFVLTALI